MKKRVVLSCLISAVTLVQAQTIWKIGEKDNSAAEFALAPDNYADFLKEDFGWEDKFYIIGLSDPKNDFPYVLPGTADAWAGSVNMSGIRTQELNILFRIKESANYNGFKLIVDLLDTHSENPPLLKITANGHQFKYNLPKGKSDASLRGDYSAVAPSTIEVPLEDIIKSGANRIQLKIIEGSWLIFDDIRLEGPTSAGLETLNRFAYLREVTAADYQLNDKIQPLLIDVEHLEGLPELTVKLDGKTILKQRLEKGRYNLEAPMPAVSKEKTSEYEVLVNGQPVERGKIIRSPRQIVTPADYVETHMGTAHSRWMIAPGPWMPFSMVKLSPDNENAGWQAGYDPSIESVGLFSHIHEWTMAGLGMLPVNGALKTRVGDQRQREPDPEGYRSAIDKATEETSLGYYAVKLTDYGIKAELTATTRCSFQRYTYPQEKDGRVMIDLMIPAEYRYAILDASVRQVDDHTIEGYSVQQTRQVWSEDDNQDYTLHFTVEFDRPISRFGGWINDSILNDIKEVKALNPGRMGCFVEFDTTTDPVVQLRTGISFVDMEGARHNLREEITKPFGWSFDAVRDYNRQSWNDILSRVVIETNDGREKSRFYTNMYRAFCRNTFSDVDGRWRDATEQIQQFKDPANEVALGCDAFWNTFWNLNQVWNLIAPEWSSRWVKSQLAMYDANGMLAKGPAGMEYIPVMVAEHEIPLMVSSYQMGIRDYDVEKMHSAIKKMQTVMPQKIGDGLAGNRDIEAYLTYRYVPSDLGRFSNSLEYSFDDWTVSQLAKALGKEEDYTYFADRGTWWKNTIDPETGFARLRKSDGSFEKEFDPFVTGANHHYVEGNAWQLTFFVPQDVPELARTIGRDRFLSRLSEGFRESEIWRYNAPGERYGDFPVVQGNQQSMHFAFLFNWVGEPWQTQKWSRSILERYYGYGAGDAYLGDEDQGQMSAWFVMAALGLFQTDGGCSTEPVYEIASPLYEKVVINLDNRYGRGRQFTIKANGASRLNKYVQSARLNGRPLTSFRFPAADLLKGGILELEMGDKPNYGWGIE
ncbi:GH92 family glycosyl hydrolase [Petrimonas mucosa]|jgi:predicted alpha-1,2-mannosidase|uniref:GH92 family glycosyl hydrolase n=1 Tax=Petrimonas mucosa TaxID=1642646 RepID=UPI003C78C23A